MEKNSLLNSVKQGFVLVMPIFVIGGFVLLLMNIPVSAVNQFIRIVWDARLFQALNILYDVTFGCAGLYVVLAVSYKFSIYKFGQRYASINIISSVVAMMSYMALVGWRVFTLDDPSAVPDVMFRYLNVNNVFIALLTAVGATELFFITYRGFDRATHNIYLGGDKEALRCTKRRIWTARMRFKNFVILLCREFLRLRFSCCWREFWRDLQPLTRQKSWRRPTGTEMRD